MIRRAAIVIPVVLGAYAVWIGLAFGWDAVLVWAMYATFVFILFGAAWWIVSGGEQDG